MVVICRAIGGSPRVRHGVNKYFFFLENPGNYTSTYAQRNNYIKVSDESKTDAEF